MKNAILANSIDNPATPPNPNNVANKAMIKNVTTQFNITNPFDLNLLFLCYSKTHIRVETSILQQPVIFSAVANITTPLH